MSTRTLVTTMPESGSTATIRVSAATHSGPSTVALSVGAGRPCVAVPEVVIGSFSPTTVSVDGSSRSSVTLSPPASLAATTHTQPPVTVIAPGSKIEGPNVTRCVTRS